MYIIYNFLVYKNENLFLEEKYNITISKVECEFQMIYWKNYQELELISDSLCYNTITNDAKIPVNDQKNDIEMRMANLDEKINSKKIS